MIKYINKLKKTTKCSSFQVSSTMGMIAKKYRCSKERERQVHICDQYIKRL